MMDSVRQPGRWVLIEDEGEDDALVRVRLREPGGDFGEMLCVIARNVQILLDAGQARADSLQPPKGFVWARIVRQWRPEDDHEDTTLEELT